jgi:hypothetical protein
MVCLIGASVGIKVLIGILYMIYYKFKRPARGKDPKIRKSSRISTIIASYKGAI